MLAAIYLASLMMLVFLSILTGDLKVLSPHNLIALTLLHLLGYAAWYIGELFNHDEDADRSLKRR